jgi:CubicO group peptidase (beta-lactamase class C family)
VRLLIILSLLVFSLNTFALDAQAKNNADVKKELDIALKEAQLKYNIPAMAVAVIDSGELYYAAGFGYLDEAKVKPVTEQSLFRVASISKLFTAQAIMQLVEKQKIGLDDTITQYLLLFKNSQITIRQLLTHSSGLSDKVRPVHIEIKRTHQAYLDTVSKTAIEPITKKEFEYSDTGFNLLGSIVSVVSGLKFEEYIQKNIIVPAHMTNSGYFDGKNGIPAQAPPMYKGKLIGRSDQRPYDPAYYPSEGLVSSIYDLSQWLSLTLTHDAGILKPASYKEMLIPKINTNWGKIYMGLGWQVYEEQGNLVARHPGGIRGYKSLIISYPEQKRAILLLTNASKTPRWKITNLVAEKLKQLKFWP